MLLKAGGMYGCFSITKDFRVKDVEAFERLKKDIGRGSVRSQVVESPSLKKSREKLATFVFR